MCVTHYDTFTDSIRAKMSWARGEPLDSLTDVQKDDALCREHRLSAGPVLFTARKKKSGHGSRC